MSPLYDFKMLVFFSSINGEITDPDLSVLLVLKRSFCIMRYFQAGIAQKSATKTEMLMNSGRMPNIAVMAHFQGVKETSNETSVSDFGL